jgi:hypothetical protein
VIEVAVGAYETVESGESEVFRGGEVELASECDEVCRHYGLW